MKIYLALLFIIISGSLSAQEKPKMLLLDENMQIESTQAVNDMYNFRFAEAEMKFKWIKRQHPNHPLAYFLLGLSQWWKIVPNVDDTSHDKIGRASCRERV